MTIKIFTATSEAEKELVYQLRYDIYVKDKGLFTGTADHQRQMLYDTCDQDGVIIYACDGERVVGSVRINSAADASVGAYYEKMYQLAQFDDLIQPEDLYISERFVVDPNYRGGLVSTAILHEAVAHAARNNGQFIAGICEPHLLRVHARNGYRPYGQLDNHVDNGLRAAIGLVLGDLDYHRAINSPMLSALEQRSQPSTQASAIVSRMKQNSAVLPFWETDPNFFCGKVAAIIKAQGISGPAADLLRDRTSGMTILTGSALIDCPAGGDLIRDGHASRTVYVLLEGSVQIYKNQHLLANCTQAGSLVGEQAFYTGQKRSADVTAGPMGAKVLALCDSNLQKLQQSQAVEALAFMHCVVQELCRKLQMNHPGSAAGNQAA